MIPARRVALATHVPPFLLRRHRLHAIPVHDCSPMTEPLAEEQFASLGGEDYRGLADPNHRFRYYRMSLNANGAVHILVGGYDAKYNFGGKDDPKHAQSEETLRKLVTHCYSAVPQLEGPTFSHAWGGAVDSCSRCVAILDTPHAGKVAYTVGSTGPGVGAARFAAIVMLDLLSGEKTQCAERKMVQKKQLPFPPEPVAWRASR